MRTGETGTVYLLHFDQPYRHARHYTGWTADLAARLTDHQAGHGARLLGVVRAAGIGWTLARTWPGSRVRERQIKRQGGASRCCPVCRARTRPGPPRAVRGHRPVRHGRGDWRCSCGVRLSGGPYGAGRRGARDVMRCHRADLWLATERS